MKKIEKSGIPAALREVWDWKEAVYRETEKMSTAEALERIHVDAAAVRQRFGLSVAEPRFAAGLVCEEPAEYKTKKPENGRD
jgi:hypothetical protein